MGDEKVRWWIKRVKGRMVRVGVRKYPSFGISFPVGTKPGGDPGFFEASFVFGVTVWDILNPVRSMATVSGIFSRMNLVIARPSVRISARERKPAKAVGNEKTLGRRMGEARRKRSVSIA